MPKVLFYFLTLWMVLWAQILSNYFGEPVLSINVVLIAVLYVGLSRGPLAGEALGFLWGLLVDVSFFGLLGLNAFLYAAAGYLAGMLRRQLDETKMWTQALFSFAASAAYLFFAYVLDRLFSSGARSLSWGILAQPVGNALMAPLLFRAMRAWSNLWHLSPEEE